MSGQMAIPVGISAKEVDTCRCVLSKVTSNPPHVPTKIHHHSFFAGPTRLYFLLSFLDMSARSLVPLPPSQNP